MVEEIITQLKPKKLPYVSPKSLNLSDLNSAQGGPNGTVSCMSPGSADTNCVDGSLPQFAQCDTGTGPLV